MTLENKILNWFATGSTGESSKAMAFAAAGIQATNKSHPSDPSDFNRCLMLIKVAPEIKLQMNKVALLSDSWEKLVLHWPDLEQCFIEEAGLNWTKNSKAPKTYKMMKAII